MRSDFYRLPYAAQRAIRRGETAQRRARTAHSSGYDDGFRAGIEAAERAAWQVISGWPEEKVSAELNDAVSQAIRALKDPR